LKAGQPAVLDEIRLGMDASPLEASAHGAVVWATTSAEGQPLFVNVVLSSDNFYEEPAGGA
jgi:hypothetical protein